jgi:hypothetical protein
MFLMAGAAGFPIAVVTPSTTQAAATEPTRSTKPELSELPGLDQLHFLHLMAMVMTLDVRSALAHMTFGGAGQVEIRHLIADDSYLKAELPAGELESLRLGCSGRSATRR